MWLLQNAGSSGGGGGAVASVPGAATGAQTPGNPAGASPDMLSGIVSNFASGDPWRIVGGQLGGTLENLFGAGPGVPREAKTAAIGTALGNSGDPLAALLGQYVGTGAQGGHVFSESGPTTFGGATDQVAAMLEALTGQQIPGVTGTGTNFSKDPTYTPGALGRVGTNLQLPQGFEFVNDPSKYPQILKDIEQLVPMGGSLAGAPGVKQEEGRWKDLLSQLQSQGILQRYQGSLGAPGAGGGTPGQAGQGAPGTAATLAHPFTNQQNNSKFATSPYPLTAGA